MNRLGFTFVLGLAALAVTACAGGPPIEAGRSGGHDRGPDQGYASGYDRRYDGVADGTPYDSRYDSGYQAQYSPPAYPAAGQGYQAPRAPMDYRAGARRYDGRVPGRFAVYLQNGAWTTRVKTQGDRCTGPRFKIMLDRLYQPTAREAFSQNFEQVVFTDRRLRPDEIGAGGYDAQIIIDQGGIDIAFLTKEDFFTDSISAYMAVEGNVAVVGPRGLVHEQRTEGAGKGTTDAVLCSDVDGAVVDAATDMLNDFLAKAIDQARRDVQMMRGISGLQRAAPAG